MSNLNRKQRRAMNRGKYQQEYPSIEEPRYLTKWRTFDGIDRILTAIENGELLSQGNTPIFMGVNGEMCEVCPSLEGWILFWRDATSKLNLQIDTATPFELIRRQLHENKLISIDLVKVARHAYQLQRQYYDQHDYATWNSLAKTARLKIYLSPDIGVSIEEVAA